MKRILLIIGLAVSYQLIGQGVLPAGGAAMSMSNAVVAMEDDWAYFNNPAANARLKHFAAGVSYENRFLLRQLQTQSFVASMPLGKGVISIGGNQYGYREFRSYKGGLGYSMKLAENLSAGVQLNYQGLTLNENYGRSGTMTAELGVLAWINPKWSLGFAAFNIGRAQLSDYEDDRYSTVMRLGTAYKFSDKVILSAEANKDLEYPLRFRTGIEYEAAEDFYLRAGFTTSRVEGTFGFGYKFQQFRLDLGTAYDQLLGWSPHFSLTFSGKDKE
jgi:hypothetical protein